MVVLSTGFFFAPVPDLDMMGGMLKHSYTTRDLLIATVAVAFALPFWMMSKRDYTDWQMVFWFIVSIFSIGVAVGALTTSRPLLVGLIAAGIMVSIGAILALLPLLLYYGR